MVLVADLELDAVVDTLKNFGLPYRTAISPDDRIAVITDPVRAEVRVVDARTRSARFTIAIPADSVFETAEVKGSPAP